MFSEQVSREQKNVPRGISSRAWHGNSDSYVLDMDVCLSVRQHQCVDHIKLYY